MLRFLLVAHPVIPQQPKQKTAAARRQPAARWGCFQGFSMQPTRKKATLSAPVPRHSSSSQVRRASGLVSRSAVPATAGSPSVRSRIEAALKEVHDAAALQLSMSGSKQGSISVERALLVELTQLSHPDVAKLMALKPTYLKTLRNVPIRKPAALQHSSSSQASVQSVSFQKLCAALQPIKQRTEQQLLLDAVATGAGSDDLGLQHFVECARQQVLLWLYEELRVHFRTPEEAAQQVKDMVLSVMVVSKATMASVQQLEQATAAAGAAGQAAAGPSSAPARAAAAAAAGPSSAPARAAAAAVAGAKASSTMAALRVPAAAAVAAASPQASTGPADAQVTDTEWTRFYAHVKVVPSQRANSRGMQAGSSAGHQASEGSARKAGKENRAGSSMAGPSVAAGSGSSAGIWRAGGSAAASPAGDSQHSKLHMRAQGAALQDHTPAAGGARRASGTPSTQPGSNASLTYLQVLRMAFPGSLYQQSNSAAGAAGAQAAAAATAPRSSNTRSTATASRTAAGSASGTVSTAAAAAAITAAPSGTLPASMGGAHSLMQHPQQLLQDDRGQKADPTQDGTGTFDDSTVLNPAAAAAAPVPAAADMQHINLGGARRQALPHTYKQVLLTEWKALVGHTRQQQQ